MIDSFSYNHAHTFTPLTADVHKLCKHPNLSAEDMMIEIIGTGV